MGAFATVSQKSLALFEPTRIGRDQALTVMERLSALNHVTGSAEQLANRHERQSGGVNDWAVTSETLPYKGRATRALAHFVARPEVTDLTHLARLTAGAFLMTPWGSNRARGIANAVCSGAHLALAPRHHWGGDGSDQVAWISQTLSLSTRLAGRDPRVADAALWVASMQAVLSYAASGWVKVAGDTWRSDRALVGIMRTKVYGNKHLYRALRRHPVLGKILGKGTLALECSYPIIYLSRGRLSRVLMLSSAGMHLSIAASMGLGRFVTAFLSLYGALGYTTQPRRLAPDRDDRMAAATGLLLAATLAGLAATAHVRSRGIGRPEAGDRLVPSRSGATLRTREITTSGEQPARTLFVLESGLMAPPQIWGHLAQQLACDGDVLVYERGGYGASSTGGGQRTLSTLADDLSDVIRQVRGERDVVVVGHSIGGYIAHLLAAREPDTLSALVLLDSSHPQALERSEPQKMGSEGVLEGMRMTYVSARLGLGQILDVPTWLTHLPASEQAAATRLYRDSRLWGAGLEEWRMTLREFADAPPITTVTCPTLVISARASLMNDDDMRDMHEAYVQASPHGKHVVVETADHLDLVAHRTHAQQICREWHEFHDGLMADRVPAHPEAVEAS